MPEPSTLALFSLAALALIVVPGPSVIYVVSRGIEQGRRAALVSALGIETGGLVHVAAAADERRLRARPRRPCGGSSGRACS